MGDRVCWTRAAMARDVFLPSIAMANPCVQIVLRENVALTIAPILVSRSDYLLTRACGGQRRRRR